MKSWAGWSLGTIHYFILCFLAWTPWVYGQVSLPGLSGRHIGPALTSGRITDIEIHPTKPQILFVGTAGGGVWKSTDGGYTFAPVFDDHCQSIGIVTIDPNDPDYTVWVGTGETWVRNSTSVGCGIFKSEDGGTTWKPMGLDSSERIASIVIPRGNSNTIYVGVLGALWGDSPHRGVYKSTDGGKTWRKILYIDASTGCSDLVMAPDDTSTLYASMWTFRRTPWSFESGGMGSGLFKSTDGGSTWKRIEHGLPSGKKGRIALAVAPSMPNRLYAVVEAPQKGGLYRSDDGGQTWQFLNGDFALTVRPFYFSRIVVDPKNPDIVIKAGLRGAISRDGGKTFKPLGAMHPDIHDIAFHPQNTDIIYVGTDGGVYRSLNKGATLDFVDNIPVAQYYHISIDDAEPFNVYGGLQDNGSWYGPSATYHGGILEKDWTTVGYGDGFRVFKHPTKPIIYSMMQSGEGIWRYNYELGDIKVIKPYAEPGDPELRFNWNTAMALSPHHPDRLYIGSQFVHRSDDMGETWQKISPDLTTNDPSKQRQERSGGVSVDNSGAENHCTVFTIAESPLNEDIIWAGTDDGQVQVTINGGKSWTNCTRNIPDLPANLWCYQILPSAFYEGRAYAVFDGHTLNDMRPYVYRTDDYGKTWTSLATDQIQSFARSIHEDYRNPDILYLGTEMGLYLSMDGGKSWQRFKKGVPPVAIHAIAQDVKSGALVLGTHGRGVIIIDDMALVRQLTPEVRASEFAFLKTDPMVIPERTAFTHWEGDFTDFVGKNPSRDGKIAYYMKKRHLFGKMSLHIEDERGEIVTTLSPTKAKGLNIVYWNFRRKPPKVAQGKTFVFSALQGPVVPAGRYYAVMKKGKKTYRMPFEVRYPDDSPHSPEDRKAQQELVMKLYELQQQLAYLVYELDEYSKAIEVCTIDDDKRKTWKQRAESLKDKCVVQRGDNYVGRDKPRLREKLADLYGDVASYPGKPTGAQYRHFDKLSNEWKDIKKEWEALKRQFAKGCTPPKLKSYNDFIRED